MPFDKHLLKKYSHKELTEYCEQYFHETFPDSASLSKYVIMLRKFLEKNGRVLTDNEMANTSQEFYEAIYDRNFSIVDSSVFTPCNFSDEFNEPVILQHCNKYFDKIIIDAGKQLFQSYLAYYKKNNNGF